MKARNRKARVGIKRLLKLYGQAHPRIQLALYLFGAILSLHAVIVSPLPSTLAGYGLLWTLTFKIIIYILMLFHYTVIVYAPLAWLKMAEVTPHAMLHFQSLRILIRFLNRLIFWIVQVVKVRVISQLTGKRQFSAGKYSLASMFSLSAFPYRLYPLSCCLLE